MESEESPLRPCKSLPLPFKDLDTLQDRLSPPLGSIFSTQGEMDHGVTDPAKDIVDDGSVKQEDGVKRQKDKIASPQRDNEPEMAASIRKESSLNLLNLPLDILKDIFKEVSANVSALQTVCTDITSRSHTQVIYVVSPPPTLPYIQLLPLLSTADST